ncbi:MAG: 30S ribosomal protein S8, partial [Epsilonproteobacteria bacterium]|nr:30S ribosomal protein S8 [Campylobacterota bacterium]
MMTDIIADSLTRIRNAAQRRLDVTTLLHANSVEAIVSILVNKGYLESYTLNENGNKKTISVVMKYDENGRSAINE